MEFGRLGIPKSQAFEQGWRYLDYLGSWINSPAADKLCILILLAPAVSLSTNSPPSPITELLFLPLVPATLFL
jgi:hypothetical protein